MAAGLDRNPIYSNVVDSSGYAAFLVSAVLFIGPIQSKHSGSTVISTSSLVCWQRQDFIKLNKMTEKGTSGALVMVS